MTIQVATKRSLSRRWGEYQPSKTTLFWACAATAVATMMSLVSVGMGGLPGAPRAPWPRRLLRRRTASWHP
jgi:hypothetical protein